MDELWPEPGARSAELIRSVSQSLLAEVEGLAEAVTGPSLTGQNAPALLADATLSSEERHINRSALIQWLTANIHKPGRRVLPDFGSRTTSYIRDLASRGLAPDFAGGWRAAVPVAWRGWLRECLDQCSEPAVLEEVLDVIAQSMAQYAIDWIVTASEITLGDAMKDADSSAIAMIQTIAGGATVHPDVAEARLNYRLARWHRALILWVDGPEQVDCLDRAVAEVRSISGATSPLVARASTTSRWLWQSGSDAPDPRPVAKALRAITGVKATVGRAGHGLEGFRASHHDALAAQAMIVRLESDRRFTAYADVELIDTLTKDRASATQFITNTLGPLAAADPALQQTLLTYVQCGFNTTRAAATLYAHRNTVERRVTRANELSTVKVEDNPAHVAAALLVLEVAPHLGVGATA
ncbi:MAG: helix-turn-helix domain-containing protein [Nocardioides sp.]|uniref:PucR family transcriptional regulator n=1 Tax=Nocardioides sp. TaxID=35761 RepID=UPI0039E5A410